MDFMHENGRIYANDEHGRLIAEVVFPEQPDGTVDIERTYVDSTLRGKGVASELLEEAYRKIKSRGRTARLSCSYAAEWFKKHPDKMDIVVS